MPGQLSESQAVAFNLNGQQYKVWDHGIGFNWGRAKASATWKMTAYWWDAFAIVAGTGMTGNGAQIFPPVALPVAPTLFLNNIEMIGIPASGTDDNGLAFKALTAAPAFIGGTEVSTKFPSYLYAALTLTWATPDWSPYETGSVEMEFGTETVALGGQSPVWAWGDTRLVPIEGSAPLKTGVGTFNWVQKNQPYLRLDILGSLLGKVNQNAWPPQWPAGIVGPGGTAPTGAINLNPSDPGPGFSAQTLLYDGIRSIRRMASAAGEGLNVWDLTHRILWKQQGWNTIFRPPNPDSPSIFSGDPSQNNTYQPVTGFHFDSAASFTGVVLDTAKTPFLIADFTPLNSVVGIQSPPILGI